MAHAVTPPALQLNEMPPESVQQRRATTQVNHVDAPASMESGINYRVKWILFLPEVQGCIAAVGLCLELKYLHNVTATRYERAYTRFQVQI